MLVKKILIPNKPHLDPIAAIYLLKKYGVEKFPGIENAEIIFWEHSHNPSEAERNDFKNQGIIMIDIGGGEFDHHQLKENIKETSTSLVAQYLGIDKNPELSGIINYIREDDLEGLHNRYGELPYLVKCMNKQGIASEIVVEFALQALEYLQLNQAEWHGAVKKEFEEKMKIVKVKRFNKRLKIGIVESDNIQVANYGISIHNLAVVIQKRSTGHVMILTNKHQRVNLKEIVAAIRKRELELRGYNRQIDPKRLQYEGKDSLMPIWFYHRALNAFMNGSDALSKTEATNVFFGEIVNFVWYGLSSEDSEYCDCGQGGETCPFSAYGFSKCANRKNGRQY